MPRKQKPFTCKESDIILLKRMASSELEPPRVQERAKMILGLTEGRMIKDVAAEFGTSKSVISMWRDRFLEEGPSALYDRYRPGRGGNAKKGVHDKVVNYINEHKETDPPLSVPTMAQEFDVSESTIFRIMNQEDISLSRQRKWFVGYTQAPQPKSTDMVGLYVSDISQIMIVCTNHVGLLPEVRGALRTKNRLLAEAISERFSVHSPDMVDLLNVAKEFRKADSTRHTRFDANQFLEVAFDSLPIDEVHEYTIFVHQKLDTPLKLEIPNLRVNLKRMEDSARWNENVGMVFDLLNTQNPQERTGADLIVAINGFLTDYTASSEPFSWIKRRPEPVNPGDGKGEAATDGSVQSVQSRAESQPEDEGGTFARCTFEISHGGKKVVYEQQFAVDIPSPREFDLQSRQFYKDFDNLEELAIQWREQIAGFVAEYLKACADEQQAGGKYRERLLETEIGKLPVTVYGELLGSLRGKESLKSLRFRHVVGFLIRSVSYRQTASILNTITHRNDEDQISHRTINDLVKTELSKAEMKIDEFINGVLPSNGFSSKTGKLRKGKQAPDVFQNSCSYTGDNTLLEDASRFVEEYNKKQDDDACKINLSEWIGILDEVNRPILEVSPDGVEGKHQKIHRRNKDSEGEKGGKTVNTSNLHLEVDGMVLALCARTMKKVFILLLAVLLHNDLLNKYRMIVFTDGGRDIKKWAIAILGFANPIMVIDWFHLKKKCNEYFSMALKGGAIHKEARGRIKREFFARLWVGNLKGAVAYLETIDKSLIKNHRRLYEMKEYLERKRYGITCYALRRHFKLRMSSNKVEKLNDINTSARQKHKGKAWSHDGSYFLTLLSTIFFNNGEKSWYEDGNLDFSLKVRNPDKNVA